MVEYDEVPNKGKTSAENLKVHRLPHPRLTVAGQKPRAGPISDHRQAIAQPTKQSSGQAPPSDSGDKQYADERGHITSRRIACRG